MRRLVLLLICCMVAGSSLLGVGLGLVLYLIGRALVSLFL